MAKNIYGLPIAKNINGPLMAKNIYGPPIANKHLKCKKLICFESIWSILNHTWSSLNNFIHFDPGCLQITQSPSPPNFPMSKLPPSKNIP